MNVDSEAEDAPAGASGTGVPPGLTFNSRNKQTISAMVKYYFFRTVHGSNHFMKLRALPNQTTYVSRSDRSHVIETDVDVQTSRESRTLQASYATGAIFCAKLTGSRDQDVKLRIHSRNGESFYRVEGSETALLFTWNGSGHHESDQFVATDDMYEAFRNYLNANIAAFIANNDARTRWDLVRDAMARRGLPITITGTENPEASAEETAPRAFQPSDQFKDHVFRKLAWLGKAEAERLSAAIDDTAKLTGIILLRDALYAGVVKFVYKKTNGDTRVAYGTRNEEIIGTTFTGSQDSYERPVNDHFYYFDIQQNDWRKFCGNNIISVDDNIILDPQRIDSIRRAEIISAAR